VSEELAPSARPVDAWQIGGVLPSGIAFEVPEGGVAVVEPPEPVAVEPVAPEPAAVEPPAPAAPNWNDPALLDLVDTRAGEIAQQQLVQLLEQYANEPAPQGQPQGQPQIGQLVDEYGQLDPNALVQLLAQQQAQTFAALDQRIQQLQAPLTARFEQETVAEGNQRLSDILADDVARNGEFSSDAEADNAARQLVRTLAEQAFPQVAQRFGNTPRAAEMAMAQAAAQVRQVLTADRASALTTEQNRIAALAGVRVEPGTAAVGVEGLSDTPLSAREIAMKYSAKATVLAGT
jgi:hypothetical protein